MNNATENASRHTFLRGHLDRLEGTQDSLLFSWLRFDLGYETVLVHNPFLSPSSLKEGDEVLVAGSRRKNRFDALACSKLGETKRGRDRRLRSDRLRRRFWFSIASLPAAAAAVLFAAYGQNFYQCIAIGLPPIFAFLSLYWNQELAKKELELAMARGVVE